MKKSFIFIALIVSFACTSAQNAPNQIGLGGEVAIPTGAFGGAFKTGFGGWVKFLFGVSKRNQLSFTSGYTSFTAKGSGTNESARIGILPLLIGYRIQYGRSRH